MRTTGILMALCLAAQAGCQGLPGSGNAKTERRQLPSFSALSVGGAYELDVTVGKPQSVDISGDDNIVSLVTTDVQAERLVVSTQKSVRPQLPLRLTITVPTLRALTISGAAHGEVRGIAGESFQLHLSGAGKVTLGGQTTRMSINSSGAGAIKAADLEAETAEVQISGAGNADVHVTRSLSANISGAGKVRYRGKPAKVTQDISGAGSIVPME